MGKKPSKWTNPAGKRTVEADVAENHRCRGLPVPTFRPAPEAEAALPFDERKQHALARHYAKHPEKAARPGVRVAPPPEADARNQLARVALANWRNEVRRIARTHFGGNSDVATDVVADALASALARPPRYKDDASTLAWLRWRHDKRAVDEKKAFARRGEHETEAAERYVRDNHVTTSTRMAATDVDGGANDALDTHDGVHRGGDEEAGDNWPTEESENTSGDTESAPGGELPWAELVTLETPETIAIADETEAEKHRAAAAGSPRAAAVLALVAEGYKQAEIGERLDVSTRTVARDIARMQDRAERACVEPAHRPSPRAAFGSTKRRNRGPALSNFFALPLASWRTATPGTRHAA